MIHIRPVNVPADRSRYYCAIQQQSAIEEMKAGLFVLACLVAVIQCSTARTLRRIPRETFVKGNKAGADETHALVFAVKQQNLDSLEKTLLERSTPGNDKYQKWLTYAEITALTANPAGSEAVKLWLEQQGAKIVWSSNRNDYIKAEAPIAVWERLLDAEFFEFADHSRKKVASKVLRADAYTIPDALQGHLHTVFYTVQTPPELRKKYHTADETAIQRKNKHAFRTDISVFRGKQPALRTGANEVGSFFEYVTVPFLNDYYVITTNEGNASQAQSVFETVEEYFSPNDLTLFQQQYDLPLQAAQAPYGYATTNCVSNDCYEGNLDVQYINGIAQKTATIYWYQEYTATSDPFLDWITDVANTVNPPLVNSISWGSTEQVRIPCGYVIATSC
jgi:tripeptidyl-peptidase-1